MIDLDYLLKIIILISVMVLILKYINVKERFTVSGIGTFIIGKYHNPVYKFIKNTNVDNLNEIMMNIDIGNNKTLTVMMHKGLWNYKPLGQYVVIRDSNNPVPTSENHMNVLINNYKALNILRYSEVPVGYTKIWDSDELVPQGYTGDYFTVWRPVVNQTNSDYVCLGDVIWKGTGKPVNVISAVHKNEVNSVKRMTDYWRYTGPNLDSPYNNEKTRYKLKDSIDNHLDYVNEDKFLVASLKLRNRLF
jgi:hypothetical protein